MIDNREWERQGFFPKPAAGDTAIPVIAICWVNLVNRRIPLRPGRHIFRGSAADPEKGI